jgi:hypothetical protein
MVESGDALVKTVGTEDKTRLAHAEGAAPMTVDAVDKTPPPPAGARTGLGTGVVRALGARIDWASLLKRVFLEDALACPCGGRRRIVSDVQEPEAVVAILKHLGLLAEAPPLARARDPADLGFGFE